MSPKWFWVLVMAIVATTVGVGMGALKITQWGPHSTSVQLTSAPAQRPDVRVALDKPLPNITLTDIRGNRHNIREARGKVVVLLVQGDKCPCSKAYVGRVNALYSDYAPKGVEVWAFNPNANETEAQTKDFVAKNGCQYPVAYDHEHIVADMLDAVCTTEVFVADRDGVLRYHGRIDDNIYKPEQVKKRDLREALDAILAGKPVPTKETRAYACTIAREENL